MRFTFITLSGLVASNPVEDDAVMLSVHAVREALTASDASYNGLSTLVDFATAGSPRKASQLLQKFASSTVQSGEAVDPTTKEKLKEIAKQLTNNTWMSLEQSHRRDQDLINMHWRAIRDCGNKHRLQMEQDVDGLEVQQVKMHEKDLIMCRGLPNHTNPFHETPAELAKGGPSEKHVGGEAEKLHLLQGDAIKDWGASSFDGGVRYRADGTAYRSMHEYSSGHYLTEGFESLQELHGQVCEHCGALQDFLSSLNNPNCEIPLVNGKLDAPSCPEINEPKIGSDIRQYLRNMNATVQVNHQKWKTLYKACKDARDEYESVSDRCHEEQAQYEGSFCLYRQALHATCAQYQDCHILTKEEYEKLIADALYAADSRKIDWKAIHKIACYIKVLVSDGTNEERTEALNKCESGDLNTLASILLGFEESNYLSLIIPEISGNVSCWDLEVMPLIDFKECDMTSVEQYPCTDSWMQRYEGLGGSTGKCNHCPDLPPKEQYYPGKNRDDYTDHFQLEEYGGGWIFVNELGHSETDPTDISEVQTEGYYLPSYNMQGLRFNEVLIQRQSENWCDSWDRQTGSWVEEDGASMCVQADEDHVYCTSNHNNEHTWRQQPVSHFAALCGKDGSPKCECWPYIEKDDYSVCFAHAANATGPRAQNVLAPDHVTIHAEDERTVKVAFRGEEKSGVLRVGNYGSFLDGVGCQAVTPVSYRVFVRCLGCVTLREDFHSKHGAQFNGYMTMNLEQNTFEDYTYEAWFRSPLEGNFHREIFGGPSSGLVLQSNMNALCEGYGDGEGETTHYHLHVGGTSAYSSMCFRKGEFYHVAVTKKGSSVKIFVNGQESTETLAGDVPKASTLARSMGGGFADGGQLFNVRIWKVARSQEEIFGDAMVTNKEHMKDDSGLVHWWPLTDDLKDVKTGVPLEGPSVRYAPIWCSDLEVTGMRGC